MFAKAIKLIQNLVGYALNLKELRNYNRKNVSATKIVKNTINILKCYFSEEIYSLEHQTKYIHVENYIINTWPSVF